MSAISSSLEYPYRNKSNKITQKPTETYLQCKGISKILQLIKKHEKMQMKKNLVMIPKISLQMDHIHILASQGKVIPPIRSKITILRHCIANCIHELISVQNEGRSPLMHIIELLCDFLELYLILLCSFLNIFRRRILGIIFLQIRKTL